MWFKVDDNLMSSDKVLSIPRRDGRRMAALGLWTAAGSWSAKKERDGYVPEFMVEELGAGQEQADDLVAAGLWDALDDGYQFHNWAKYQPTRDALEAKREATRQRVAAWRERKGGGVANNVDNTVSNDDERERNGVTNDAVTLPPNPTRTRPDPNPVTPTGVTSQHAPETGAAVEQPRHDVEQLLDLLDEQIARNGAKLPGRNKTNRDAMRLMLDRDGRSFDDVRGAILWCQQHEFWRSNILSAAKLREQFDTLRMQAQRGSGSGQQRPTRMDRADDMIDELERMEQGR